MDDDARWVGYWVLPVNILGRRLSQWRAAFVRLLSLVARPARRSQGRDGVVIEPYRGYGSQSEMFLIGRVFRQTAPRRHGDPDDLRMHLRDIGRRIRRRRMAGALLTARFGTAEETVATDPDGYFRFHLDMCEPPPADRAWHVVNLTLHLDPPIMAEAQVFIPPAPR